MSVRLKHGREKPLLRRHPWVMSGSIDSTKTAVSGDVVAVLNSQGKLLGYGDYDAESQIRVRMHHFTDSVPEEEVWLRARLEDAYAQRETHPLLQRTNAFRWVNAEADGLPGLTVDRYADWVVVKASTPAMQRRTSMIAEVITQRVKPDGIYIRGDAASVAPAEAISIDEHGREYWIDLKSGQKTGFYLDQRDARELFRELAAGTSALDLFAYSGGFAAAALQGGAKSAVAVDSSYDAIELLKRNAAEAEAVGTDVNEFLRQETKNFDLISVDPPPFAKRKRDVDAACRAYKDLNLRTFKRANPGAHILTFTCSHHISAELFRKVIAGAALDAGREVEFLRPLSAPVDHPVSSAHPEGEYLKGLLVRVRS